MLACNHNSPPFSLNACSLNLHFARWEVSNWNRRSWTWTIILDAIICVELKQWLQFCKTSQNIDLIVAQLLSQFSSETRRLLKVGKKKKKSPPLSPSDRCNPEQPPFDPPRTLDQAWTLWALVVIELGALSSWVDELWLQKSVLYQLGITIHVMIR